MRQKKNNKLILIIIILLVILILITGSVYTYFSTDILKSNKELFFKYIGQMVNEEDNFIETQLEEYFEKQKHTPFLDEGSIAVNVTSANNREQLENINNMNVTFNGQVDTANSQVTQNVNINYSDKVKFPLSYKQIGNTMGIQTNYIGSKYIAINKEELQNSENEDINSLVKLQKLREVSFTKEDLQRIKNTYLNVLTQELEDSNFSKIEETNSKGYQLTLKGEKLKSILVKLLETLKNDQATLDKINEYIKTQKNSLKITATSIDNKIKEINRDIELNSESIEILVYQTKGKTTRFIFKTNEAELKLEKTLTGNDQQYNIELQINHDNQTEKITFISKFAGLQSMQSITENYELTLETKENKYQYQYNNNIEFTDSTNIEEFNNNNSLLLSQMEEEQKNTFLNAAIQRIQNINKEQMQELGLEENENPLQYAIPQLKNNILNSNSVDGDINEQEVTSFNTIFENYESTNLQGVTVKGLLSTIQRNNEMHQEDNRKIKEIHFDGQEYEVTDQNITLIKSSIETETAYRVEFERDEDTGVIYRAVINKK